jgi:sulfhydrogenase subunit alpha
MGHKFELTRVAGNARLTLKLKEKEVEGVELDIYETSRFFENFLVGKKVSEVPYLVSRVCGVCDVAHMLGSLKAIENACGIVCSEQVEKLRELLCLSGIIHSHVLHLYFMVLPDLFGSDSLIELSSSQKEYVKIGMKIEEAASTLLKTIGGRSTHLITSTIGGFSKFPKNDELKKLLKIFKSVEKYGEKTVEIFSKQTGLEKFEKKTRYFALKGDGYPLLKGNIISSDGIEFKPENYANFLQEYEVPYSTSKFVKFKNESYMVGALARLNIHYKNLPGEIKESVKIKIPNYSPFLNNLAQAIEISYFIKRIIEILENLELRKEENKCEIKDGEGISATEAPRGILYHHYKIENGRIKFANIITPTAQNLADIEESIKKFVYVLADKSKDRVTSFVEKLVRAYDPCISCASHFLEVKFV